VDAIAWREAVVALDIKNSGLSFADQQVPKRKLNALKAGDTSHSPMLQGTPGVTLLQAGDIRTRTFVGRGGHVLIAYNYTNQTETVTFDWFSTATLNVAPYNENPASLSVAYNGSANRYQFSDRLRSVSSPRLLNSVTSDRAGLDVRVHALNANRQNALFFVVLTPVL
jgi:hypothetical protein